MEYGASCEDIARVCHAHPVNLIDYNQLIRIFNSFNFLPIGVVGEKRKLYQIFQGKFFEFKFLR